MAAIAEPRFIAPEIAGALSRLIGFFGLKQGWDDEHALAPDPEALRAAMLFLLEQIPSGPAPSVGPGLDGSIELEWELPGRPAVAITFGPGEGAFLAAFTPDAVIAEVETTDAAGPLGELTNSSIPLPWERPLGRVSRTNVRACHA